MENIVTELVCTRLSHDIIGNIGAVANAVELLEEGDVDFMDDIKSILKTSSQTLSARLKFFRMVFGLSNSNLENMDIVFEIAQNYLKTLGNKDYPIFLNFKIFNFKNCRTALLMLMIMADTLIRGGQINLFEDGTSIVAQISSETKLAKDKINKINEALSSDSCPLDAGLAPLYTLIEWIGQNKISLQETPQYFRLVVE